MPGKERNDESGQYTASYTDDDFLTAIQDLGGAAGTREIAETVGCHRDTARRRLHILVEQGQLRQKRVGDSVLWMLD
ncbi:helix-turn-helix domain-containing protein [Halegenticoccus tardaugens]|uniref:helix-turn-helix domain-containing protein n=1 Tax=Halegenticoccus tardaugens TaxID=2071624 RepID=UPI00100ADED1|nr:helix-turn-helix domain-containing protein [Halegenticoccus tardaugens]